MQIRVHKTPTVGPSELLDLQDLTHTKLRAVFFADPVRHTDTSLSVIFASADFCGIYFLGQPVL